MRNEASDSSYNLKFWFQGQKYVFTIELILVRFGLVLDPFMATMSAKMPMVPPKLNDHKKVA